MEGQLLIPITSLRHLIILGLWGLILLVGLFSVRMASGREYIEVHAPLAKKYTIAVPQPKFLGGGKTAAALGPELMGQANYSLKLSGIFTVLDPGAFDSRVRGGLTPGPGRLQYFAQLGCHLVIVSGFQTEGKKLRLEMRLYDPGSGQMLLGKRYQGPTATARQMVTRFIDEVIFYLTGQRGLPRGRIAFINSTGEIKELYVLNLDYGRTRQLTRLGTITLSPAWSPDGRKIVFCSYRGGFPALYTISLASQAVRRLRPHGTLNITPAWGPQGLMAATLNRDGDQELYLLNRRGKIARRLTASPGIDLSPCFSPDGRQVAFVSNRQGNPQIYLISSQGGPARRLTFSGSYNVSPAWSPDGDRIAYASRQGGRFQIFTISLKDGKVKQLTHQGSNESPTWSPEGRFIAYSSTRGGQRAIYLINLTNDSVVRLTHLKGKQSQPAWSPGAR